MKEVIYLQKIGDLDDSILITLRRDLAKIYKGYNIKVKIYSKELLLSDAEYVPERRQYESKLILQKLIKSFKEKPYFRVLGVIDKDAFSKNLNFVFGTALMPTSKHRLAFISVIRLTEKFYGRSQNKKKFEIRVFKEAIHELGHTFGLKHCDNLCVMRFSNSLLDTDRKPAEYCDACSIDLKYFLMKEE